MRLGAVARILCARALWLLALLAEPTAASHAISPLVREVATVRPNSTFEHPALDAVGFAHFGSALAMVRSRWLAIGAPRAAAGGSERGAVYLLELDATGGAASPLSLRCIPTAAAATSAAGASSASTALTAASGSGAIADGAHFGAALAALDVDGDGELELIVGADQEAVGPGFVDILFLRANWWEAAASSNGSVATTARISEGVGGFSMGGGLGPLVAGHKFGSALAPLNDLDGDGVPEVHAPATRACAPPPPP